MADRTHWLSIINSAGNDRLGQTLIRLAGLAEANHLFEQTREIRRKDSLPVHGRDPKAVVRGGCAKATMVRREAN